MAIYEQDRALYEEDASGNKTIIMPVTRVNNVEGIGRSANAAYVVGDVVYVDNNKKVALKCTTAGTTSSSELDVSSKVIGNTVTDGGVKWQVCNRTSDVTSVNGQTGDVNVGKITDASISGRDITLSFADGTTKTLTTQDTAPYTGSAVTIGGASATTPAIVVESYVSDKNWYRVYSDGWVEQGGYLGDGASGKKTQTFPKAFANTNYTITIGANRGGETTAGDWHFITEWTTTNFTHSMNSKQYVWWYACGQGA